MSQNNAGNSPTKTQSSFEEFYNNTFLIESSVDTPIESTKWPDIFLIDNGWNKAFNEKNIKKYCDTDKKSYHGDFTLDIIQKGLKIHPSKIHLVNVYEPKGNATWEPKVEKQASLERVLQTAKEGDIMLMNMELYRDPYNLPITHDPSSLEIVKKLIDKKVICIFPAGNAGVDLNDYISKYDNYLIAGSLSKSDSGLIYSSNYMTSEDSIKYITIPPERICGLSHSSAAAAVLTNYCIRKRIAEMDGESDTFLDVKTFLDNNFKDFKKPEIVYLADAPIVDNGIIKITKEQFFKWKNELNTQYKEKATFESIAKLISPINRNLFPFPRKLKFPNNQHNGVSRSISKKVLNAILNEKNKVYLGLKICFGLNEDGDIVLLASGYFKEKFDLERSTYNKHVFDMDYDTFSLNFDKDWDEGKVEAILENLELIKIDKAKRNYYIKEFRHIYKKTDTRGIIININLFKGLLEHLYSNGNDELKIMVVSDSRKMLDNETPDQEFGILVFNHDGTNPVCFIKDRVLNQADDTHTCPPMPKCDDE